MEKSTVRSTIDPRLAAVASGAAFTALLVGVGPFFVGLDDGSDVTTFFDFVPRYGWGPLGATCAAVFVFASLLAYVFWARQALVDARAAESAGATRFRLGVGTQHAALRTILAFVLSPACFFVLVLGRKSVVLLTAIVTAMLLARLANHVFSTFLVVGTDGFAIENGNVRRFVSFADVDSFQPDADHADAVIVFLKSGEKLTVRTTLLDRKRDPKTSDREFSRIWNACIEACTAWRAREEEAAKLPLARGNASVKEWIAQLDTLRAEGYRNGSIPEETLWKIVEDEGARPEDRAAALVALRSSATYREQARQRVRLDASAEPRLRVVFDAVALENEDALERALDELDQSTAK